MAVLEGGSSTVLLSGSVDDLRWDPVSGLAWTEDDELSSTGWSGLSAVEWEVLQNDRVRRACDRLRGVGVSTSRSGLGAGSGCLGVAGPSADGSSLPGWDDPAAVGDVWAATSRVPPRALAGVTGVVGPGLAVALAVVDPVGLTPGQLVELMSGAERLSRWAQSVQLAAVAAFTRFAEVSDLDDRDRPLASGPGGAASVEVGFGCPREIDEFCGDGIGAALGVTYTAARQIIQAAEMAAAVPAVASMMAAGQLDVGRVKVMARELGVRPEAAADRGWVVEQVGEHYELTPRKLQRTLRRKVMERFPDGHADAHRRECRERRVWVSPQDAGMAIFSAYLSADEALSAYQAVNAEGWALHDAAIRSGVQPACQNRTGEFVPMDAYRADAFTGVMRQLLDHHLGGTDEGGGTDTGASSPAGPVRSGKAGRAGAGPVRSAHSSPDRKTTAATTIDPSRVNSGDKAQPGAVPPENGGREIGGPENDGPKNGRRENDRPASLSLESLSFGSTKCGSSHPNGKPGTGITIFDNRSSQMDRSDCHPASGASSKIEPIRADPDRLCPGSNLVDQGGDPNDRPVSDAFTGRYGTVRFTHHELVPATASPPTPIGNTGSRRRRLDPARVMLHVYMAASTVAGLDNQPADLLGYGPIPADHARELVEDARVSRILTDPFTGNINAVDTPAYRVPRLIRWAMQARDRSCVFPTCDVPANDVQADHTVPHPFARQVGKALALGTTRLANLQSLCTHHHRLKTHAGWTIQSTAAARIEWISPTGHSYYRNADWGPPATFWNDHPRKAEDERDDEPCPF